METATIIIGAGVSGLQCARTLREAGHAAVVLERDDVVGGRCATLRVQGQAVDAGPMFLHGHDPRFLGALRELEGAAPLPAWPRRIQGSGPLCAPEPASAHRFAFPEGLDAFPRHLARNLDLQFGRTVTVLGREEGAFQVRLEDGEVLACRNLVLAVDLEEARALLGTLPPEPETAGALALLSLFRSQPCLTVLAGYPRQVPAPLWDLLLPEDSPILQLVALDSGKRPDPPFTTLVCQGRPRWSRERLEAPEPAWSADLLRAAALELGDWVLAPLWTRTRTWRHARVDRSSELAGPLAIPYPGGCLGLAGDLFSPGGGVQAAWLSGSRMAQRLLGEEHG